MKNPHIKINRPGGTHILTILSVHVKGTRHLVHTKAFNIHDHIYESENRPDYLIHLIAEMKYGYSARKLVVCCGGRYLGCEAAINQK